MTPVDANFANADTAPVAVASPENVATALELLTFKCGGRRYAVNIMAVREIRGWSQPTPLPHSASFMLGMVNLRGSVLPVMDLAQRLGQPPTEENPRNVIIVIQQDDRVHGLLVDAVSDIVHPASDQLQDVPKGVAEDGGRMAESLFIVDDKMIQVLAMDRILPQMMDLDGDQL